MRKNILGVVVLVLVFFIAPGVMGNIETHYTKKAVVVNVKDNNVVVVVDKNDEMWSFVGDSFSKGDKVKLTMFNNYTDDAIYDDEIVRATVIKK